MHVSVTCNQIGYFFMMTILIVEEETETQVQRALVWGVLASVDNKQVILCNGNNNYKTMP